MPPLTSWHCLPWRGLCCHRQHHCTQAPLPGLLEQGVLEAAQELLSAEVRKSSSRHGFETVWTTNCSFLFGSALGLASRLLLLAWPTFWLRCFQDSPLLALQRKGEVREQANRRMELSQQRRLVLWPPLLLLQPQARPSKQGSESAATLRIIECFREMQCELCCPKFRGSSTKNLTSTKRTTERDDVNENTQKQGKPRSRTWCQRTSNHHSSTGGWSISDRD